MDKLNTFDKVKLSLVYFAATISMGVTEYTTLDFVARGIRNLTWEDFSGSWLQIFLGVSAILLLFSSILIYFYPKALTIAMAGIVFGWLYYIISNCALFLWVSIYIFSWPKGIISYWIPCILLFIATIMTRRYLKRMTTRREEKIR